jgi:hypothetical protein
MAITRNQADTASPISIAANSIDIAVAQLDAAAGKEITKIVVSFSDGSSTTVEYHLDATASGQILGGGKTVLQAVQTALLAGLSNI